MIIQKMIVYHPFQSLYFNSLITKKAKNSYEGDYHGLGGSKFLFEISKDNNEQQAVKEYVDGLENNIEYYKEWCAIYQTQRDLARSKVSQLEMKVLQLQHIILQQYRTQ